MLCHSCVSILFHFDRLGDRYPFVNPSWLSSCQPHLIKCVKVVGYSVEVIRMLEVLPIDVLSFILANFLWFKDLLSLRPTCKAFYSLLCNEENIVSTLFVNLVNKGDLCKLSIERFRRTNRLSFLYLVDISSRFGPWPTAIDLKILLKYGDDFPNYGLQVISNIPGQRNVCVAYQGRQPGGNRGEYIVLPIC